MMHNVEKSGFRKGEYIAYSGHRTYRVRRRPGKASGWYAAHYVAGHDVGNPYVYGRTLAEVGAKLDAMR